MLIHPKHPNRHRVAVTRLVVKCICERPIRADLNLVCVERVVIVLGDSVHMNAGLSIKVTVLARPVIYVVGRPVDRLVKGLTTYVVMCARLIGPLYTSGTMFEALGIEERPRPFILPTKASLPFYVATGRKWRH